MKEDDDVPVFPLLGYGTGIADEAVVVSLEMATNREAYDKRQGSWVSTAMTAEHAIELGRELIDLGEKAKAGWAVN